MCLSAFIFVGCQNDDRHKISFIVDGRVYETVRTSGYETIPLPENPVKTNYEFDGWYWDTEWETGFGETAFETEPLLVNIKIYAKFVAHDAATTTSVTLPNSLKKIDAEQFYGYTSLESITIPKSVTQIGANAFLGCNSLTRVNITDLKGWCNIQFANRYSNPLFYAKNLYLNGEPVTDLIIPNTEKKISNYAFYNAAFQSVTIPNSVTEIGEQSFKGLTTITSLTIPNSVKVIGGSAFEGCTSLESVAMGNSVTSIYGDAFKSCNAITRVDITDLEGWLKIYFSGADANPLNSAHKLYLNNSLVTDLVIPDSIQRICNYAFKDYTDLKSVVIGNNVKWIDESAFEGCTSLEGVVIGNSVTTISVNAFKNCAIKNITIPNSVKFIYNSAFEGCTSLESVKMGDSVIRIDLYAFKGCNALAKVDITNLASWCNIEFSDYESNPLYYAENLYLNDTIVTDLDIPNTVTKINAKTFYNCESLKSVTIPASVKTIGEKAFYSCSSLEIVDFGSSITSIGDEVFYLCSSLKDIIIPTSLTNIGSFAFSICNQLSNVFYLGTENQWGNSLIKDAFKNVTIYFYSSSQPTTTGNFWHNIGGEPTIWGNSGN